MFKKIFKNQKSLFVLALIAALVLCTVFTIGGITSFFDVSAGKKANFNDVAFSGVSYIRILATLAYISLNALYVIWLWLWRKQPVSNDLRFSQLLKPALPFLLLAFIAYPLSNDVYLYLQYGLMGIQGVNPYMTAAGDVYTVLDPFLYWRQTSTYGPISEFFFIVSALFVRFSPVLGVYVFKGFCLFCYGINAYLIWRFLKPSSYRSKLTLAFLFNPFLLIAHITDAHVDVFLCCSVILLIGFLYNRAYIAAILAIAAGFLTKTLPIIWLPLVVGFLIWRRRWGTLAIAAVACVILGIGLSHTVFPTLATWKSLLNPGVAGMTARSFHHLANLILSFFTGTKLIENATWIQQLSHWTFLGFAAFYIWTLLKPYLKRGYGEANLITDLGWVTLVLLLGATPWLMPWYPSVLLPFAILSVNAPVFSLASLAFCLTTGAVIGAGSGDSLLSLLGCLITLGPAIAVLLCRQQVLEAFRAVLAQPEQAVLPVSYAASRVQR